MLMPMTDVTGSVEFVRVDSTDGQISEAEEWADYLAPTALSISGKDTAAYALAYDQTSDYSLSADSLPQDGVPTGQLYRFRWTSHTVYPGVERGVWLYLPHAVTEHEKVNLLMCQDGPCITVAVFLSVTALQLSVAHDSSGAATYRHLLSVGPVQAAGAARRVL